MLLKGIVLGFSIAAPVGPIGVLCIRRSLINGRLAGFVSGLGAATADGFYGALAVFGLSLVLTRPSAAPWLDGVRIFGGLFLLYLAIKTWFSVPAHEAAKAGGTNLWSMYASTVFLTLTNPATILAFAAIFAGVGVTGSAAAWLVVGVFIGSACWWLLLSSSVSLLRERVVRYAAWINKASALILLGFAVVILWQVLA